MSQDRDMEMSIVRDEGTILIEQHILDCVGGIETAQT